jgi:sulfatase maturation enzyme AslB (radical SAM superfamily)
VTEWVVEASTFCNLRCAYCYQWDGLADQRGMPLELWRKVLRAACDYHMRQEARHGAPMSTRIIWHGGEPLALPLDCLTRTCQSASNLDPLSASNSDPGVGCPGSA